MASIKANVSSTGQKTYSVHYRDAAKKAQQETFKKKADADRRKAEIEVAQHSGQSVSRVTRLTLAEYANAWLDNQSGAPSTKASTRQRFRLWILPQLGAMPLPAILPSTLVGWLNDLVRAGKSPGYAGRILTNLSQVLAAAVDDGLLARNPCQSRQVKVPRSTKAEVELWTSEQIAAVRAALDERWQVVVDLGTGLGLRQGEIAGLAVDDVDFLRRVVHVRRQVQLVDNRPVFTLPKGGKQRDVVLSPEVAERLAAHLQRHPARVVELPWTDLDGKPTSARLVLTNRDGAVVRRLSDFWIRAVRRAKAAVADELDWSDDTKTGTHQLRHWYASHLLAEGVSVVEVAKLLGHADPSITLRVYAHVMPSSDDRVRAAVDRAFAASGF